ncbi:MAG: 50S ribosomal protein L21 [Chloroflexi bacterium]|nr:50S ribosomal protein L21 [Chloroflexota bacterium]
MYAVVETGGKQYTLEKGSTLDVELLPAAPGETVSLDRVLLVADGDQVTVGTPTVAGATITATVLESVKGPKVVIFKYKPKIRYRRKTGHRQQYTRLLIEEINTTG